MPIRAPWRPSCGQRRRRARRCRRSNCKQREPLRSAAHLPIFDAGHEFRPGRGLRHCRCDTGRINAKTMAYTKTVREQRRCKARTFAGRACRAWAVWGKAHCSVHLTPAEKAEQRKPLTCSCPAYAWPHRPTGGLCQWPDPPGEICPTPAGPHAENFTARRARRRLERMIDGLILEGILG